MGLTNLGIFHTAIYIIAIFSSTHLVGHPWANDFKHILITKTLPILFILFVAGSVYQFVKQRKVNKSLK